MESKKREYEMWNLRSEGSQICYQMSNCWQSEHFTSLRMDPLRGHWAMTLDGKIMQLLLSLLGQSFWSLQIYTQRQSGNGRAHGGDTGEVDCTVTVEVFWDGPPHVGRVTLWRWPWNHRQLSTKILEKTLHVHWYKSPKTEVFELIEIYSTCGLEMTGKYLVTLEGESAWSLLRSPRTEVFELVDLYLGDSLEMAGHLVGTRGRLHIHYWCLWGCIAVEVSRDILWRQSRNVRVLSGGTGGGDSAQSLFIHMIAFRCMSFGQLAKVGVL